METRFYVEVGGLFARLMEDGETIDVVEDAAEATLFEKEVAAEVIEALKSHGIDAPMEIVEVEVPA